MISGLKINFAKSSLCGMNIRPEEVANLVKIMGCKVDSLPIKYLGLPMGASPRRLKTWDPVIEKTQKRLVMWRSRFIASGGKLTLINSNTGNLPIYFMSLNKMSIAIAKKLEKLQRQFFWGDTIDKRNMHMIKWEDIAQKKSNGGLGVKRLMQQNMTLLAKWWWRFSKDKDSLWVKVIKGKYGLDTLLVSVCCRLWLNFCHLEGWRTPRLD